MTGSRSLVENDGPDLLLRELGRLNSELVSQRRLSATTVHDLSNPAQVVLGLSELVLEHQQLDPVVRRRLEQMHRAALTMTAMLADLGAGLALGELNTLSNERVDLVALIASVVERTRVLAVAKEMQLEFLVDGHEDQAADRAANWADHGNWWVEGDPVKLERAVVNLLGNAIKFSPQGSTVSIAVDRGTDFAEVAIHDQGPGISDAGQARIFDVFEREENTAHLPGQGLGLFITKQIVESHSGTISVESQPGRGATFLLQLPLLVEESLGELG